MSRFNVAVFAALWQNHAVPTQRIADAMGITRQGASWHARRMGLPSRAKVRRRLVEPELLAEMWLAGVSSREIAAHFGMAHHSCAVTAAKNLGLPRRKRGPSGTMNGGWLPTITAAQFLSDKAQGILGARMAEAARVEQAAMINAEMADRDSCNRMVGFKQARELL